MKDKNDIEVLRNFNDSPKDIEVFRNFDDNPKPTIGRAPKKQHTLLDPSLYGQISGRSRNKNNPLDINSLLQILDLKRFSSPESIAAKNLSDLEMREGIRVVS